MVQTRNGKKQAPEPEIKEIQPPKEPKPKRAKPAPAPAAKPKPAAKPATKPKKKKKPKKQKKLKEAQKEAEPIKAIAAAIVDLAKPAYDDDYLHYLTILQRNREWKSKNKQHTTDYMKARLKDDSIRERYNKARREAYAKARAKGPARVRGRPRIPIKYKYVADAENAIKAALGANTVNVGNLLTHYAYGKS